MAVCLTHHYIHFNAPQIHAETFGKLVGQFHSFRPLLSSIKAEYDLYIRFDIHSHTSPLNSIRELQSRVSVLEADVARSTGSPVRPASPTSGDGVLELERRVAELQSACDVHRCTAQAQNDEIAALTAKLGQMAVEKSRMVCYCY